MARGRGTRALVMAVALAACGDARQGEAGGGEDVSSDTQTSTTEHATTAGSAGVTSAGAGASGGGSETTGCEFTCPKDLPIPGCDPLAQDCPEGQKCVVYVSGDNNSYDAVKCVDVTGDGQLDDACTTEPGHTGVDTCDVGYVCLYPNEEGFGTCYAMCLSGSPEEGLLCPPNTKCDYCQDCLLVVCMPGCDPLLQDCDDGETCIVNPDRDGFSCVVDASGGAAPEGTPCEFANACNPGLICVDTAIYPHSGCEGALGCCTPFCDLVSDIDCQGLSLDGAECTPYLETLRPSLEHIGVCGVPD